MNQRNSAFVPRQTNKQEIHTILNLTAGVDNMSISAHVMVSLSIMLLLGSIWSVKLAPAHVYSY